MNTIESKVEHLFYEKDICVNCTDRPWYNNAWGSNITTYGIEVHKTDAEYVMSVLTRLGIDFKVRDARFVNSKGCWTHKSFKFLEIPNHEKAYSIIAGCGSA
ncbi:MAG: hypothetical protein IJQ68_05505 [Methanobrevibacter sp.]|uniref:hypothetical protein n=1 Tax=Methanobrevibacter sp. TaxID=66852 RepID=UPI0025EBEA37|nr:hypothetical protein [Methanobrevibacter sp.]MBR0271433.1 hypothetical protein [Methanobrevibacter sp.]